MSQETANAYPHDHVFLGEGHARNERRAWLVIALTATMMVVEISAGTIFGSMALLADGWHMSTHASALLITALAYQFARKHARNQRFTFGTGKLGDLAAFSSAPFLPSSPCRSAGKASIGFATPFRSASTRRFWSPSRPSW